MNMVPPRATSCLDQVPVMCRCGRRRKHARRVMACWPSQLTLPHTHRVCSSCLLSVIVDRNLRRDRSLYARASSCHLPIALLRRDRQEPTFATVCQRANLATWYRRRLRAHDSRLGRSRLLHGRTPRRVLEQLRRAGSGVGPHTLPVLHATFAVYACAERFSA